MENVFIVGILAFFGFIVYIIIKERIYVQKRKKIVAGARFNNKWIGDAAPTEWVTVVECDYPHFCVYYRVDGEEDVKKMEIREFVKVYVP
jgi:hypothetical protein